MKTESETTSAARDAVQPDTLDELFGGGPELPKTYWIDRWARENEQKLTLLAALKMVDRLWSAAESAVSPGSPCAVIRAAIAKAEGRRF